MHDATKAAIPLKLNPRKPVFPRKFIPSKYTLYNYGIVTTYNYNESNAVADASVEALKLYNVKLHVRTTCRRSI